MLPPAASDWPYSSWATVVMLGPMYSGSRLAVSAGKITAPTMLITSSRAGSSSVSIDLRARQVKLPTKGACAAMFASALDRAEPRIEGLSDAQRRMAASMSLSMPICIASFAQARCES